MMNVNLIQMRANYSQYMSNKSNNSVYSQPAFKGGVDKVLVKNPKTKKTLKTFIGSVLGCLFAKFAIDKTKQKDIENYCLDDLKNQQDKSDENLLDDEFKSTTEIVGMILDNADELTNNETHEDSYQRFAHEMKKYLISDEELRQRLKTLVENLEIKCEAIGAGIEDLPYDDFDKVDSILTGKPLF